MYIQSRKYAVIVVSITSTYLYDDWARLVFRINLKSVLRRVCTRIGIYPPKIWHELIIMNNTRRPIFLPPGKFARFLEEHVMIS